MAVIKGCAAFHPFLATLPRARTQGRWRRRAASHEALVREDSAPVGRRKTLGAWEGMTLVQRQCPGPSGGEQALVVGFSTGALGKAWNFNN